jgi:hypothetical protein
MAVGGEGDVAAMSATVAYQSTRVLMYVSHTRRS